MRKLIVNAFLTLDGVMQAPGSPNDKSGGFTHGGWTVPFWDDAIAAWQGEATSPAPRSGARSEDVRDLRWILASGHGR